jgi:hypothetical protein
MKKLNNTIIIDMKDGTNTNTVLDNIFSSEDNSIFDNVYKIIEWKMSDWFIKKGVTQKKEDIYIYVDSLPDYFKAYTTENDKYLRICIKHKIKTNNPDYKKIKSRFIIKNIKSSYYNVIKGLSLIKIINYMEISDIPNTKLININLNTEINIHLPYKDGFENYLVDIFNIINDNFKTKLNNL